MRNLVITVGIAFIMAAIAVFGRDCQVWLETGASSSTTVGGVLDLLRLDVVVTDQLNKIQFTHHILEIPFYLASITIGLVAFTLGCIRNGASGR
jgi:hypothetical protein